MSIPPNYNLNHVSVIHKIWYEYNVTRIHPGILWPLINGRIVTGPLSLKILSCTLFMLRRICQSGGVWYKKTITIRATVITSGKIYCSIGIQLMRMLHASCLAFTESSAVHVHNWSGLYFIVFMVLECAGYIIVFCRALFRKNQL